jgi:multidrug efflux system membrane fusion protein
LDVEGREQQMTFRKVLWSAAFVLAVAVAFGVYAPDEARKVSPRLGVLARTLHDSLRPAAPTQAAAPASAPAPGPAPVSVSVAPVNRADFPLLLEGLGQVQAENTVTVRARVDGQITKIAFKEGQMVKAGDLLAEIDHRPFQAALEQANAKKTQDEATVANAKLDLQRYSTLAKQSYATQQQLDTQQALVNQLTAQIAADVAAIDAAQVQLDYTTIHAPISGRVGFRLVDEGNIVSAAQQTGIVTIAQLQPVAVVFTAPGEDVERINTLLASGQPKVSVKGPSGGELATGKLTISDNQVDPTTGTIKLKAEFENKDDALWPGLAVTTELSIGIDKNTLIVPATAVQHGLNGLFVYIVDDHNQAAVRPVTVIHQNTEIAAISKGVNQGDRVITMGQFLLKPGTPVSIGAPARGS